MLLITVTLYAAEYAATGIENPVTHQHETRSKRKVTTDSPQETIKKLKLTTTPPLSPLYSPTPIPPVQLMYPIPTDFFAAILHIQQQQNTLTEKVDGMQKEIDSHKKNILLLQETVLTYGKATLEYAQPLAYILKRIKELETLSKKDAEIIKDVLQGALKLISAHTKDIRQQQDLTKHLTEEMENLSKKHATIFKP
jgi:hypothetical protein